jgi:hypothetical protein
MRLMAALCFIIFLAGCTSAIPNKITPEEYELYSQWTTQHFPKEAPKHLYLAPRTIVFRVFGRGCSEGLQKQGVDKSLINAFAALGQAEFPLDLYDQKNMRIPWPYIEAEPGFIERTAPNVEITYLRVSRVAFNRSHTEALFEFSEASCAGGECSYGGARYARKEKGKWTFRSVGCQWVS